MRSRSINIHIAIATLVAMLGTLSGFLFLGISESNLTARVKGQSLSLDRARALREYERLAGKLAVALHPQIAGRDALHVEQFGAACRDLDRSATEVHAFFGGQFVVQQQLADIHRQVRHWLDEVIASLGKAGVPGMDGELTGRYDALTRTIQSLEQSVRQIEQQTARDGIQDLQSGIAGMNETSSGVAAIVIMGVLVIWCWSIGVVRRGLRAMEGALSNVARGNASPTLDPSRLPVEFQDIVKAYHDVCRHLVDRSTRHAREMETLNEQLLKGLITMCSSCKKIKTERGQWVSIETYVRSRTTAEFTHGLCEECLNKTLDNI